MTSRRRWIARALASGVSLVVALLALEVLVRVRWFDEVDTETLRRRQATIELEQIAQPSLDEALHYELHRNLDTSFRGFRVVTGPEGYRIAPEGGVGADGRPPEVRIALLGDSSPFGLGVEYGETYGELYRQTMETLSGHRVELRNYSVPGYNAEQELRVFETRVAPAGVDLVIVHHDHNDAEPAAIGVPEGYLHPEIGDNFLRSAAIKWLIRRSRLASQEVARKLDPDPSQMIGGYIASGPRFEALLAARRELADATAQSGVPVVALLFHCCTRVATDYQDSPLYRELHRGLGRSLTGMGYLVLDLMPRYQTILAERGMADMRAFWISDQDRHPNAVGHQLIAEQLVAFTRENPSIARVFDLHASRDAPDEPGAGG